MRSDFESKRREAIAFVAVGLVAGLLVNLLASVVFEQLYKGHEAWFMAVITVLIIAVCVYVFLEILAKSSMSFDEVSFCVTFDPTEAAFVDGSFGRAHLNAKLLFAKKPEDERRALALSLEQEDLWLGPMHRWVDDFVRGYVVSQYFGMTLTGGPGPRRKALRADELAPVLSNNELIRSDYSSNSRFRVIIPEWTVLQVRTDKRPSHLYFPIQRCSRSEGMFLCLASRYGDVRFTWSSTIGPLRLKMPAAGQSELDGIKFDVKVRIEVERRFLFMFTEGFRRHLEWTDSIVRHLPELAWGSTNAIGG